jgi:aspartate-semialdehyde dehydrogenase
MIRAAFPGHETNMSKQFKVAVVGATGAVGEVMLSILAERDFPASDVIALASERSAGMTVAFGNGDLVVQDLATFDPAGVDIALFSAGGAISARNTRRSSPPPARW